jgi:hypothetical protein
MAGPHPRADWLVLVSIALLAGVTAAAPFTGIPVVVSIAAACLALVILLRSAMFRRRPRSDRRRPRPEGL